MDSILSVHLFAKFFTHLISFSGCLWNAGWQLHSFSTAAVTSFHKPVAWTIQIYYPPVLEVQSVTSFSLGNNQWVSRPAFLSGGSKWKSFPCTFKLLQLLEWSPCCFLGGRHMVEATCVPRLLAPVSLPPSTQSAMVLWNPSHILNLSCMSLIYSSLSFCHF